MPVDNLACTHMGPWPQGLACRVCYRDLIKRELYWYNESQDWKTKCDLWMERAEKAEFDIDLSCNGEGRQ